MTSPHHEADTTTAATLDPTVNVARDLTEIANCYADLEAQAIADGDNPDIPGGDAMVTLGPVAHLELWLNLNDATERWKDHPDEHLRRIYTSIEDEEPDEDRWPPHQTIWYWSGRWRTARAADYDDQRRTIASELNYVRESLAWALEHEPRFEQFTEDIRHARIRIENIVAAGRRADRSRIVCDRPTCASQPEPPRLVKTYSPRYVTGWTCATCTTHTPATYRCTAGHPAPVSADRCTRMVGPKDDRHQCLERTHPEQTPPPVCFNTRCPSFAPPTEVHASDPTRDGWKCPTCKHRYTPKELQAAHARMLWRPEAERWVRLQEAVATLKSQGRGERTIRRWLAPRLELVDRCLECAAIWPHREHPACPAEIVEHHGEAPVVCGGILEERWHGDAEAVVEGWCDVDTHTTWIWWPDLWRLHLATRRTHREQGMMTA